MKDPVCGMTVTDKSFYHVEHQGQTHYFCGTECKLRFAAQGVRPAGARTAGSPFKLNGRTRRVLSLTLLAALLLAGTWLYSH